MERATLVLVLVTIGFASGQLEFSSRLRLLELDSRFDLSPVQDELQLPRGILDTIQKIMDIRNSSFFPTAFATNVSETCKQDSLVYLEEYQKWTGWALQMQESTARRTEGFYGGFNTHAVGIFDQCLRARAPNFRGKYCTAFFSTTDVILANLTDQPNRNQNARGTWINWYQWIQLLIGTERIIEPQQSDMDYPKTFLPSVSICIPSSCSAEDFRQAVAELVGGFLIIGGTSNTTVVTSTDERECYVRSEDPPQFDGPDIAVLVTLSLLGSAVVAATIYEAVRLILDKAIDEKKEHWAVRLLYCFSALNNGRKLLSTETRSDDLSCIHGIRFLSTTWVMMSHSWMMALFVYNYTLQVALKDAYKGEAQVIVNATVSVDSFFLLSGFLVAYLLLIELDRNRGKFNPLLFYLNRYLRLTPVYAIIFGFTATLIAYLNDGPTWSSIHYIVDACRVNWWRHFLYVDNLVQPPNNICMTHTWYLNTDMQLFLISPLLIYPLWKWKKIGLVWNTLILAASVGASYALFIVFDLQLSLATRPSSADPAYIDYYYNKPWTRGAPYFVGILIGWLVYATRNSGIKLNSLVVLLAWLLSIGTGLAVVYGLIPYIDEVQVPQIDPAITLTYGPLHRLAWGVALGWVLFACVRGYGGFIDKILSWKPFMVLGRLTYVAYLIHPVYYAFYYGHVRKPMYYTTFDQTHIYLSFLVMIFGLSFLISLAIEAPLLNVQKLVFSSFRGPRKETSLSKQNGHKSNGA